MCYYKNTMIYAVVGLYPKPNVATISISCDTTQFKIWCRPVKFESAIAYNVSLHIYFNINIK